MESENGSFGLNINDMDKYEGSNIDSISIISTLKKQNAEYIQELLQLRSELDKSRDRDSTYKSIDTHKLYEALVSVLEITPEIKEDDNAYAGSWATANKYKMDDSIHALINELDKRYKQLD
jgi:hypothetical protein